MKAMSFSWMAPQVKKNLNLKRLVFAPFFSLNIAHFIAFLQNSSCIAKAFSNLSCLFLLIFFSYIALEHNLYGLWFYGLNVSISF